MRLQFIRDTNSSTPDVNPSRKASLYLSAGYIQNYPNNYIAFHDAAAHKMARSRCASASTAIGVSAHECVRGSPCIGVSARAQQPVYQCECGNRCIDVSVRGRQSVYRCIGASAAIGVSVYRCARGNRCIGVSVRARCIGASVYRCEKRLADPNPERYAH